MKLLNMIIVHVNVAKIETKIDQNAFFYHFMLLRCD